MARVDRVLSETKLFPPLRRFAQLGIAISLMPVIAVAASASTDRGDSQSVRITQVTPAAAEKQAKAKRGAVKTIPMYDVSQAPTIPPYPKQSLLNREEGAAYLDLLIGRDGTVREVKLKKSSGYPALDETAIAHVRTEWRLKPGTIDGVAQPMWVTVPIIFRLKNDKPETAPDTNEDKSTATTV